MSKINRQLSSVSQARAKYFKQNPRKGEKPVQDKSSKNGKGKQTIPEQTVQVRSIPPAREVPPPRRKSVDFPRPPQYAPEEEASWLRPLEWLCAVCGWILQVLWSFLTIDLRVLFGIRRHSEPRRFAHSRLSRLSRMQLWHIARGFPIPSFLGSPYERVWVRYRRHAVCFSGMVMIGIITSYASTQPLYQASASLTVNDEAIQDEWQVLKNETRQVDFREQIQSRAVLEPVLETLGLYPGQSATSWWPFWKAEKSDEDEHSGLVRSVEKFRKRLEVEQLRHSQIYRITISATSPELAAKSANAVAQSFIDYRRQQAVNVVDQTLSALDEEMPAVKEELERLSAARAAFLAAHGWDDYDAELQNAQEQVETVKTALQELMAAYPEIEKHEPIEMGPSMALEGARGQSGVLVTQQSLDELSRQLAVVDGRLGHVMSRYGPKNPLVAQAQREKQALERVIHGRLQQHRAVLEQRLEQAQRHLGDLLAAQPQADALRAAMVHAEEWYGNLLGQRSDARLALKRWNQSPTSFGSLSIMEGALPPPARSDGKLMLVATAHALFYSILSLFLVPLCLNTCRGLLSPGKSQRGPATGLRTVRRFQEPATKVSETDSVEKGPLSKALLSQRIARASSNYTETTSDADYHSPAPSNA